MRRVLQALIATPCLVACGPEVDDETPPASTEPTVMLASVVGFEGAQDGVSAGFDLDGVTTSPGDVRGCGIVDYVTPDGEPGVDNAFAGLMPIIELAGGRALYGLVQEAVDMGELLIMLEVDGWEDALPAGTCLPARLLRGLGDPVIGGDDRILPGQTFDPHPEFPVAELDCAEVQADGSVVLDGFEYRLPLQVLDESIDLTMYGGRARLWPTDTGWRGVLAGGIQTSELAANVQSFDAIPAAIAATVVPALDNLADLDQDDTGRCRQLSVTLGFDAVSAYFFADDA